MSGHSHDDHHSNEQKPVAFTVPFILACVVLVFVVAFLSLCNPKKGHHGECKHEGECSKECMKKCEDGGHDMKECEGHKEGAAEEAKEEAKEEAPVADSVAKEMPAGDAPAEAKAEEAKHH